ncbi:hypothetical protein FXO37_26244 [Capsicum annuum]|nr:hypothetical protein FXO37_26244 [Capsicum annuum]
MNVSSAREMNDSLAAITERKPQRPCGCIVDENSGGFPNAKNNGMTNTRCESKREMKAPSLVARLMGLESMPAGSGSKPQKASAFETWSNVADKLGARPGGSDKEDMDLEMDEIKSLESELILGERSTSRTRMEMHGTRQGNNMKKDASSVTHVVNQKQNQISQNSERGLMKSKPSSLQSIRVLAAAKSMNNTQNFVAQNKRPSRKDDLCDDGDVSSRNTCINFQAIPDSAVTDLVGNSLDHHSSRCVLEAAFSTDSYLSCSPNSSSKPDKDLSNCETSSSTRRSYKELITDYFNNVSGVLSKIDQLKGSKLSYAKQVILNSELIFGTAPQQQALPVEDGFSVSHFLLNEHEMFLSLLWMTFGENIEDATPLKVQGQSSGSIPGVVQLQEIIIKELDIHVGTTTGIRASFKVLQEIMGDHIVEYGRIFYYRDEILRTNPGSTCVVKVGDVDKTGQLIFQGSYVCFHALRKAFFKGARRLIGLDGCFFKGVWKGQMLVAVCRDENNQMLLIAWAVVEVENQFTWGWFVKLLKNGLELGEGHQLSIISDMQKGHNKRSCPIRDQPDTSQSAGTSSQAQATTNIASATKGKGRGKDSVSGGSSVPNISSGRGRGMTQESQTSSASGRGKGTGVPPQRQNHEDNSGGHTRHFKRSRMPGMPSRKVISTGAKGTKRSEVVTGDIGYTPRQGFKWKRKSAITNNKLEKIRTEKVIQTRSATATKTQGKNISTMKTHVSWK